MRHDWIFDVLADLRAYAEQNDLPALAEQVTETLRVADMEIGADAALGGGGGQGPRALRDADKRIRRPH